LTRHFPGNMAEQGLYLGLPLLLLLTVVVGAGRRRALVRISAVAGLIALVLSLGPLLHVAGHVVGWLPDVALFKLPLLWAAMPARFALYVTLAAAVLVAVGLAGARRSRWPRLGGWAAAVVSVAVLAPAPVAARWWRPVPAAVTSDALARAVSPGSTVISLPFWNFSDDGVYAQAASGFSYNLVDSWLQTVPVPYAGLDRWQALSEWQLTPGQGASLERRLCALHIGYAAVWPDGWRPKWLLWALHLHPVQVGGVLVYRMPPCRGPEVLHRSRVRRSSV
jgi:hypothetical protein